MKISVNKKTIDVPDNTSILEAINLSNEKMIEPQLGIMKDFIPNKLCPLLGIAEVNEELIPISFLSRRLVTDKMSITTNSDKIKKAIESRAQSLLDHHECHFIKEWQKMIVAEAESSGYVNYDEWNKFSFDPRGVTPSIYHDPNLCIRCQNCVTA